MLSFRNNFSALRSTSWLVGLLILLAGCQNSDNPSEQAPAAKLMQGPVDRLTLALMGDPEDEVNQMGLIALQGDSLPGVQKLLASNDPAVRFAGVEILEEIVAPGAIEMLIASLEDPDESVRLEVVEALGTWQNAWPFVVCIAEKHYILFALQHISNPSKRSKSNRFLHLINTTCTEL